MKYVAVVFSKECSVTPDEHKRFVDTLKAIGYQVADARVSGNSSSSIYDIKMDVYPLREE